MGVTVVQTSSEKVSYSWQYTQKSFIWQWMRKEKKIKSWINYFWIVLLSQEQGPEPTETWVRAAEPRSGTGCLTHLHSQAIRRDEQRAGPLCVPSPVQWHLPGTEPPGSVPSPSLPAPPGRFRAVWWALGQFAGGALQKETLGPGVKLQSCHVRQWQSPRKKTLISIPRALCFFRRKAPTFSS